MLGVEAIGRAYSAITGWFGSFFEDRAEGYDPPIGRSGVAAGGRPGGGDAPSGDLFARSSDGAVRPEIRNIDAPDFRPGAAARAKPIDDDPRIMRMRRAAVFDIFDQAGLDIVPAQFWSFLAAHGDPFEAVVAFLAAIGIEPRLIQMGEQDEVERANEVIDLLVSIEGRFDHLSAQGRSSIEAAIFSGVYEKVREAAEITSAYVAIVSVAGRWPQEERFPALNDFLATIAAEISDPMSASADDARSAQAIFARMIAIMNNLGAVAGSYARLHDEMERSGWPDWPEEADIAMHRGRFTAGMAEIFENIRPLDEIDGIVTGVLRDAVDRLEAFADRHRDATKGRARGSKAGGGRKRDPGSGGGAGSTSKIEVALLYFDFAIDARPTAHELAKAWKTKLKRVHPDLGGSHEQTVECNDHHDLLKSAFGF